MVTDTGARRRRPRWAWVAAVAAGSVALVAGCGGGADSSRTAGRSEVAAAGRVDRAMEGLLGIIEQAGMGDYAAYGRDLQARGRLRIVTTDQLDPALNAFTWNTDDCIWYGEIAFTRYDRVDQAEILLHEMVHLRTGEVTHTEVDKVCAEYRARVAERGLL